MSQSMPRVLQWLKMMVQHDTVNPLISHVPGGEAKLAAALEKIATQEGLKTQRLHVNDDQFNLLVTHEVGDDRPWLLFDSHLDTVGVDGMTIDPFGGEVRDGRLYGRGASDTKATGAAMLDAACQYTKNAEQPNNIAVLFTVDEEIAKGGVFAFVREQLPTLGWKPSGCVIGEPTMLAAVTAHNGAARWTLKTTGRAAHSSDPSAGRNAISMMAEVICAIDQQYIAHINAEHPLTGRAAGSITTIRGGEQINIIPASCEIEIDRRVVPGEDLQAVLPAVQKLVEQLREQHPHLEVSYENIFLDPALDPEVGKSFHPHVAAALASCGLDTTFRGAKYGTNASAYSNLGLPAIVLGPGDIAQAHTCDEWIASEQVERAVDVYLALMQQPLEKAS